MEIDQHRPGTVCWVDLGTRDPDATSTFYAELFGWTVTPPDPEGYRICLLRGRAVAGIGPSNSSEPPYWTTNITVPDIAGTARACIAAGARIVVPPTRGGDLGSFAVAIDPAGAPLSLWQPDTQTGMQLAGETGTFSRATLSTSLPGLATAFYKEVFGWRTEDLPCGDRAFLHEGDLVATFVERATDWPSRWLVAFAVSDVRRTVDRAQRLGATVADPDKYGADHIVDPAGAVLGLTSGPLYCLPLSTA